MTWRETGAFRRALREANAGGSHTRAEWMAKLESQAFLCFWCGKLMRDKSGKLRATKDHLVPLTRGGSHSIENIAGACRKCNSAKHTRTAEEYRTHLIATGGRISAICTLAASTEETIFAKNIPPEVKRFTDSLVGKKFPSRPEHYWEERRAFLRWQVESLIKGEAATLVFQGMEVKKRA